MNYATQYQLRASNGSKVIVRRGTGAAKMTQGGGNWETVARPRRVAMTRWTGRDPYGMDLPVLFDGYADERSVEADIARVNQMQMSPGAMTPPPTVQIDGAVPIKGATWVITGIEWGDQVIWHAKGSSGFRWRQDAVIHLLQFVPDNLLKVGAPNLAVAGIYVVKNGDSLRSIAKYWYGDATKAKLIQTANNIRDPKSINPGQTLRMPVTKVPTAHPVGKGLKVSGSNVFGQGFSIGSK